MNCKNIMLKVKRKCEITKNLLGRKSACFRENGGRPAKTFAAVEENCP
jgi:hypothetical protein